MRTIMGLFLIILSLPGTTTAQPASELSDDVRKFVKVDAPVVALTHVRVVDGTSAAAIDDQTVVLADGKILSIGPSAEATLPAEAEVLVENDVAITSTLPVFETI